MPSSTATRTWPRPRRDRTGAWSTGTLCDNVVTHGNSGSGLNIRNALNEGTGHGWQGANYVIWNSTADRMKIFSPPTAQNWVIGSIAPTRQGDAIFDSWGTPVSPPSLYRQQLSERLRRNDEQEVWLGDIGNFTPGISADQPPVDPTWLKTVQAAAGSDPVVGFDVLRPGPKWIPFTFKFDVPTGQRVISASLSLAMRGTGDGKNDRIYLNGLNNSSSFSQLGWTIPTTGSTPKVLDLSTQLGQLQGGQFNVAVADEVAIDWAVVDVQFAPKATAALELSEVKSPGIIVRGPDSRFRSRSRRITLSPGIGSVLVSGQFTLVSDHIYEK